MFSHPQGFWGIQTNDLRWQQSVKASVGQADPTNHKQHGASTERLEAGKSFSFTAHAPSLSPLTASESVSAGSRKLQSCNDSSGEISHLEVKKNTQQPQMFCWSQEVWIIQELKLLVLVAITAPKNAEKQSNLQISGKRNKAHKRLCFLGRFTFFKVDWKMWFSPIF